MRGSAALALLLCLTACAISRLPVTCAGLVGVRAVPVVEANGRTTIRYTYANDALRVPHLRCRADLGERSAMVELARAYETGHDVPHDDALAATLYEKAAQDRAAYTSIYSPPVRLGGSGRMLMLPNPGGGPGNAEAKYRLGRMLIEGRGIASDSARGQKLVDAGLREGFQP
jgi:hypothetical protein